MHNKQGGHDRNSLSSDASGTPSNAHSAIGKRTLVSTISPGPVQAHPSADRIPGRVNSSTGGMGMDKPWGGKHNGVLRGEEGGSGVDGLRDTENAGGLTKGDSALTTPGGAVVSVRSSSLTIRGSAKKDHHITVKAHRTDGKQGQIDKIKIIEKIGRKDVKSFYPVNRRIDKVLLEGGNGNDRLQAEGFGHDVQVTLDGGGGDDTIIGGKGNDTVRGGAGNDTIYGNAGNDHIRGGAGNDLIRGGGGNDYIAGDRDNDELHGGKGDDHLSGDIGDDHLFGDSDNDYLSGGMGADVLGGGTGDDVLSGDEGPDFLDGDEGNDTESFATNSGPGADPKHKHHKHPINGVIVNKHRAYGGPRAAGGSGRDVTKHIDNVIGSAKDDVVNGNFNSVDGGPGNDTAHGNIPHQVSVNGEPDPADPVQTSGGTMVVLFYSTLIVRGSAKHGNRITVQAHRTEDKKGTIGRVDIIEEFPNRQNRRVVTPYPVNGPIESVVIEGGDFRDRLQAVGFGADVPVRLSGGKGNDTLVGGAADDVLNDGAGNDTLIGGGGDDGLTNSQGRDHLNGGKGNDLLVSSSIDKGDRLFGGAGKDSASFAQMPRSSDHPDGVRAEAHGTAQRIHKDRKGYGPKARISVEDLEGSEGDDVLIGNGALFGRGGDDIQRHPKARKH